MLPLSRSSLVFTLWSPTHTDKLALFVAQGHRREQPPLRCPWGSSTRAGPCRMMPSGLYFLPSPVTTGPVAFSVGAQLTPNANPSHVRPEDKERSQFPKPNSWALPSQCYPALPHLQTPALGPSSASHQASAGPARRVGGVRLGQGQTEGPHGQKSLCWLDKGGFHGLLPALAVLPLAAEPEEWLRTEAKGRSILRPSLSSLLCPTGGVSGAHGPCARPRASWTVL